MKLAIAQARPTSPPLVDAYLACTLAGCRNRYYLPRHQRLRSLPVHAELSGWKCPAPGEERCPDHLPGRPLQLEAARLDPNDTLTDWPEDLDEILAAACYYAAHTEEEL